MQAIILAGGFGARLRALVSEVPKPLAPIHGKPFLSYLMDYLKTQGITRVILSVHYKHEKIQAYFQSSYNGISIEYAVEDRPLGTGGAIKYALELTNNKEPVFVLNGDTWVKLNYYAMYALKSSAIIMCLCSMPDTSRYGSVTIANNKVVTFNERGGAYPGLINAGVYLINPDLFEGFPRSVFSFEKDFLFANIHTIKPQAFIAEGDFFDIGVPEDYEKMGGFVSGPGYRLC
jgi:D-glycero-alpha-D-manno-heptose 1-phosphate guanylyltransferase